MSLIRSCTFFCLLFLCAATYAQNGAIQLPLARPAVGYAAQLSIPPGLGYPFKVCRLSPQPSWLTLHCPQLTLTGRAPAGRATSYSLRLELADAAGNEQSYLLSLTVSNAPEVVALGATAANPSAARHFTEAATPLVVQPPAAQEAAASPAATVLPAAKSTLMRPATYASTAPDASSAAAELASASNSLHSSSNPAPSPKATVSASSSKTKAPTSKAKAKTTAPAADPSCASGTTATTTSTALPIALSGSTYFVPFTIDPPTGVTLSPPLTYKIQSQKALALYLKEGLSVKTASDVFTEADLFKDLRGEVAQAATENESKKTKETEAAQQALQAALKAAGLKSDDTDDWFVFWRPCAGTADATACPELESADPVEFTILVTDNAGNSYSAPFSIQVKKELDADLVIPKGFDVKTQLLPLPDAYVGQQYNVQAKVAQEEQDTSRTPLSCVFEPPPSQPDDAGVVKSPLTELKFAFSGSVAKGDSINKTFAPSITPDLRCYQGGQQTPADPIRLTIQALSMPPVTHAPATVPCASAAHSDDANIGMFRYYFVGGELLSKQDSSFSHSDLFLDFHVDRTLWLPGSYPNLQRSSHPYLYPGLQSYFDIRLSSLPAAVQSCTQNTTPTGNQTSTSSCVSGTSTTSGTTDSTQVFLNTQKSANVSGGFYFPFMLPIWAVNDGKYGTFVAPIAKVGFQTTTDNLNQTQQSSANNTAVSPVGSSATFYKNYSYGGRIGLYRLPTNAGPGHAPEIEHYLDITLGRFSNLPTVVCGTETAAKDGCSSASTHHQQQYRIAMEGLMQVPGTSGFSIGFGANLAQREIGNHNHHYDVLPGDDLRFLFGYKYDLTKLVNLTKSKFDSSTAATQNTAATQTKAVAQ